MLVTILRQQVMQDAGVLRVLSVGQVVDLPDPIAARLIAIRSARMVASPERAVITAPERAVTWPREHKRRLA